MCFSFLTRLGFAKNSTLTMFSFTQVLSMCVTAYICSSAYQLYGVYFPEECGRDRGDCIRSFMELEENFELQIYSSPKKSSSIKNLDLVWNKEKFDEKEPLELDLNITAYSSTRKNGTLYIHFYLFPLNSGPYDGRAVMDKTPLHRYIIPERKAFQLMSSSTSSENEGDEKSESAISTDPVTHVASEITFSILADDFSLFRQAVPQEVYPLIKILPGGNHGTKSSPSSMRYLPIMYVDGLRVRESIFKPLNTSLETVPIKIRYAPVTIGGVRLSRVLVQSMKQLKGYGFSDHDLDEVKSVFTDTSIYLLLLTVTVSAFHLMFDFLAFKNDIQFWRTRKTMVGLSSRVIVWRCFSSIVVLLYLQDQHTSLLVLIPAAISALIEMWKLAKAFKVSYKFPFSFSVDRHMSEAERRTDEFDSQAMGKLTYVLFPLCIGGAIYSLLYTPHKSWYSWCLTSLVNLVYAFGFIFMLPQLFVNYKLKSVAHLPWRAFMYKAFNTFIDDVFAFIITMPTAHRLACFRDDVVFVLYLYQRWLYPVDMTRVNEFGQSFDEAEAAPSDKPDAAASNEVDDQMSNATPPPSADVKKKQ